MNRATSKSGQLTEEQKAFVVSRLATWEPASHVRDELKERWGVSVTPQAIDRYKVGNVASQQLAERWKVLFAETRAAFIADATAHGIAHKSWRLKQLQAMAENAIQKKNHVLAASLLEQGAKEMGDMFTNTRKHQHEGGISLNVTPEDANL